MKFSRTLLSVYSTAIFVARLMPACFNPSRAPRGAGYHVLADTTWPVTKPARDAADRTRVPSRVRAMKRFVGMAETDFLERDDAELAVNPDEVESDHQFVESWCDELLARSWAALAATETSTGQPWYTVLRFRADHPEMRSPQIATQLAAQLGRPFTAAGVRQALHRARQKFADLLLNEVTHTLGNPTASQLEQELVDLGLLDYCRPALERRSVKV